MDKTHMLPANQMNHQSNMDSRLFFLEDQDGVRDFFWSRILWTRFFLALVLLVRDLEVRIMETRSFNTEYRF